jgi:tetratricopeptide (TPR) repeat protein
MLRVDPSIFEDDRDHIHELSRSELLINLPFLLALLGAIIGELIIFSSFAQGKIAVFTAAFGHIIITALLAVYAAALHKAKRDINAVALLTISCGALGLFGVLGVFVTVLLNLFFTRSSMSFREWFSSLFPEERIGDAELLYEHLQHDINLEREQNNLTPFMDVVSLGNAKQKQEAITKMMQRFDPVFAPAMLQALKDNNNAIRVQAATAISRIETDFLNTSLKLDRLQKEQPNNKEILLAQANHYDNYAFTGLLDPMREEENREIALQKYQDYLQVYPNNEQVRVAIGRMLLRARYMKRAKEWFNATMAQGIVSGRIVFWYMECLFELGEYEELRSLASAHREILLKVHRHSPAIMETVQLWAGETKEQQVERASMQGNLQKGVDI